MNNFTHTIKDFSTKKIHSIRFEKTEKKGIFNIFNEQNEFLGVWDKNTRLYSFLNIKHYVIKSNERNKK